MCFFRIQRHHHLRPPAPRSLSLFSFLSHCTKCNSHWLIIYFFQWKVTSQGGGLCFVLPVSLEDATAWISSFMKMMEEQQRINSCLPKTGGLLLIGDTLKIEDFRKLESKWLSSIDQKHAFHTLFFIMSHDMPGKWDAFLPPLCTAPSWITCNESSVWKIQFSSLTLLNWVGDT